MDKILAKTLAKAFKYLLKVAMWTKYVKYKCSKNHFGKTLHYIREKANDVKEMC